VIMYRGGVNLAESPMAGRELIGVECISTPTRWDGFAKPERD
jgi:hypothetical protein